jgi:HTH-type transcriptional regulator, competence development regulator
MSSQSKSTEGASVPFGEWLRQLRETKAILQRDVAAAADMDVAVLSKIELGQRVATEDQTRNLAKFFGVNETEAQARRMVEKFRQEGEENPEAARRAVCILAEGAGLYRTKNK